MLYINNTNLNPYFNHALEEHFLKNTEEECFILWRSSPCILIGKNQNAYQEINIEYVKEHNLPVVRRLSGGGAIFNDLGNILFGFITNDEDTFIDFERFTKPVIKALKSLGVNAELSGRNDIVIDGKKFSGNAQARHGKRVLHHGSLLYSSNMTDLAAALNVRPIKLQDKGIKSIASRVTNISDHMANKLDVTEFKDYLLDFIRKDVGEAPLYELSEADLASINNIMESKTSTWEWNFGKSPKYSFTNERKLAGGIVEINMNVTNGLIQDIKINGDFFGKLDIGILEAELTGIRHDSEAIGQKLQQVDFRSFLSNIEVNDFIEMMFRN